MFSFEFKGEKLEISNDAIKTILEHKIERTATIRKNARERLDGSIKDLVANAIANGLDASKALGYLIEKDKDQNAKNKKEVIDFLKSKGIGNETTEKPTDEDYAEAIKSVLAGGGQND